MCGGAQVVAVDVLDQQLNVISFKLVKEKKNHFDFYFVCCLPFTKVLWTLTTI